MESIKSQLLLEQKPNINNMFKLAEPAALWVSITDRNLRCLTDWLTFHIMWKRNLRYVQRLGPSVD